MQAVGENLPISEAKTRTLKSTSPIHLAECLHRRSGSDMRPSRGDRSRLGQDRRGRVPRGVDRSANPGIPHGGHRGRVHRAPCGGGRTAAPAPSAPRSSTTRGTRHPRRTGAGRTGTSTTTAPRCCRRRTCHPAACTRPRTRGSCSPRCARSRRRASAPSSSRGGASTRRSTNGSLSSSRLRRGTGSSVAIHVEPYRGRTPARAAEDIARLHQRGRIHRLLRLRRRS